MVQSAARERFEAITKGLKAPVMVAPMFLVSTPDMVIEAARSGLIGAFPGPNARTVEDLEQWLETISSALPADSHLPWAMNMIVHKTYSRFPDELALVAKYKPSIVITALGSPAPVIETVHEYGGLVFADVITPTLARKAVDAGADGLVLVCSGAGGHTGRYSPFAFVREVREFFDGPLIVGGAISDGRGALAAELLGADLVYMGTRFIACPESMVEDPYREMLARANAEGIIETKAITGVSANFMAESLVAAGYDLKQLASSDGKIDFSGDIASDESKAWKHVWGAGQGVGSVKSTQPVSSIAHEIIDEYRRIGDDFRTSSAERRELA